MIEETIKAAHDDLVTIFKSFQNDNLQNYDWNMHLHTIKQLEEQFEFITPANLEE